MPDMEDPAACFAPLSGFYDQPLPRLRLIAGSEMPEPYRSLLVNEGDMTPTLERHHGCRLGLRVIESRGEGAVYCRRVALLDPRGRAVEFGAIRIHLETLPGPARDLVLAGRRPLGGVLIEQRIEHASRPSGFFAAIGDEAINQALGLDAPCELYGRCNTLVDARGRAIAEVVEILPPATNGTGT